MCRANRSLYVRLGRGARARLAALTSVALLSGLCVGIAAVPGGAPIWLGPIAGALVFVGISAFFPHLALRQSDRQLAVVAGISDLDTSKTWARLFPQLNLPTSPSSIADWLSSSNPHEIEPDKLVLEASGLTLLGRYGDARARLDRIETDLPRLAFARSFLAAQLDFNAGGLGSLAEAQNLADELDHDDRRVAVSEMAFEEAARAVVRGEDWGRPIGTAYRELGGLGLTQHLFDGIWRLNRYRIELAVGMLIVALITTWMRSTT